MREEGITTERERKRERKLMWELKSTLKHAVVFSRERIVPDLRRCELVKPSDVKRISVCFNRSPQWENVT